MADDTRYVAYAPTPEPKVEATMVTVGGGESSTPEPAVGAARFYAEEYRPGVVDKVVPPVVLLLMILGGMVVLMIKAQYERKRRRRGLEQRAVAADQGIPGLVEITTTPPDHQDQHFLSDVDLDTMDDLYSFFNQPLQLLRVALPAVLALALCPLIMVAYPPMADFFWPTDRYKGTPNINEAVACFLAPAGLVYATTFGFSYQYALEKQQLLRDIISDEISLLDQIVMSTSHLQLALQEKCNIFRLVKEEVISMALQIQGKVQYSSAEYLGGLASGQVWRSVKMLQENDDKLGAKWGSNRVFVTHLVDLLLRLNGMCSHRIQTLNARIHPLQWVFLETLSFFSFFGVLLLKTYSYRLDLTVCMVTVFSIALLSYLVSDLDSPFNGVFRISLAAMPEMISKTKFLYEMALEGVHVALPYHGDDTGKEERRKFCRVMGRQASDPSVRRLSVLSHISSYTSVHQEFQ